MRSLYVGLNRFQRLANIEDNCSWDRSTDISNADWESSSSTAGLTLSCPNLSRYPSPWTVSIKSFAPAVLSFCRKALICALTVFSKGTSSDDHK